MTALQRVVHDSTVAVGSARYSAFMSPCFVGFNPEENIPFGVHELSIFDPIHPKAYEESLTSTTGQSTVNQIGFGVTGNFCPQVATAAEARVNGVSFLLVPNGASALQARSSTCEWTTKTSTGYLVPRRQR